MLVVDQVPASQCRVAPTWFPHTCDHAGEEGRCEREGPYSSDDSPLPWQGYSGSQPVACYRRGSQAQSGVAGPSAAPRPPLFEESIPRAAVRWGPTSQCLSVIAQSQSTVVRLTTEFPSQHLGLLPYS